MARVVPSQTSGEPQRSCTVDLAELAQLDPARTLIVPPCSAGKVCGGYDARGTTIVEYLPTGLADRLTAARKRIPHGPCFDGTNFLPAWRRYAGNPYAAIRERL